jgi:hypothetical protein
MAWSFRSIWALERFSCAKLATIDFAFSRIFPLTKKL